MGVESDGAWFFLAQLLLPVENPRTIGGGFGFGDLSFLIQCDRQGREREWVIWFELRESLAGSHRFVKTVQLLQCARESVQGFRMCGSEEEALFIFRNGIFILAFCKQIETSLEMCVCTFGIRGHLASVSMAAIRRQDFSEFSK